jgi:hypothetical protein
MMRSIVLANSPYSMTEPYGRNAGTKGKQVSGPSAIRHTDKAACSLRLDLTFAYCRVKLF